MNTNNKTKTAQKRHLHILSAVCLSLFLFVTATFAQKAKLPENGKIAFAAIVKGHYDIFVINSDGSGQTNITNSPDQDEVSPSWSPDGEKLAFLYKLYETASVLGVMDADGKSKTFLLEVSHPEKVENSLSWSPEGKKIAFGSEGDIYTISIDGTELVNLTNDKHYDRDPSWSPEGSKIAFESEGYVYLMNADGDKVEKTFLGVEYSGAYKPKWSPDGERFLYYSDLKGNCSCLISSKTDGTNSIILNDRSTSADWSPDGTKVVFAGSDGSSSRIYVMYAKGDGRQTLIGPKNARQPDWQPLPAKLTANEF